MILQLMYYFLPAYAANMTPVFLTKIFKGKFSKPISKELFGLHKTWRGLIGGIIIGALIFFIQKMLFNNGLLLNLSFLDYGQTTILLGLLLSFGALIGDLAKSYFKRIAGIKEGQSWFPFDQLDYIIGALLFSFIIFIPSLKEVILIIAISFLLHIIVKFIGYSLNIDKSKF